MVGISREIAGVTDFITAVCFLFAVDAGIAW